MVSDLCTVASPRRNLSFRPIDAANDLEIAGLINRPFPSGLRRSGQVVHLPGRYVMEGKLGIVGCAGGKPFVKPDHRLPEQHLLVLLRSAVRVELDEEPIRTLGNLDAR